MYAASPPPKRSPEERRARQRMHVRRSYYRKLEKMNAMRDQVRDLKEQYWRMLDLKERQMRGKEHDASALLAMTPTHRKAMKLHMQISRVKEELLAESAALQKMLEGQEAVTYRMSQLLLEMNQELSFVVTAPKAFYGPRIRDEDRFGVWKPVTSAECEEITTKTYMEIQRFLQSNSYLTTGATIFGWRDRRKVDGDRLKFSLKKVFPGATACDLSQRSWELAACPTQHRSLHSAELNARLYRAQTVDENNVVIYRVFYSDDGKRAAKSLFLVSRFEIEKGYVLLLRSIEDDRLRKNYEDEVFEDNVFEEQEQWIYVFSWLIFEQVGGACKLDFGGNVRSTNLASCTLWMLEVLLIALRWESKVIGPIFSLA
uniref:START domain-containing protein n=1 Tax=Globisporangium ultimum (strain ATCC 200006 / CBS 805.95 / DAOM BR144) TaxID=431595 RepID=K3WXZ2_GLOUD